MPITRPRRALARGAAGSVAIAIAAIASAPSAHAAAYTCTTMSGAATTAGDIFAIRNISPYGLQNYTYTPVIGASGGTLGGGGSVGSGWNIYSAIRAGANGYIYAWKSTGELYYYQRNTATDTWTIATGQLTKSPAGATNAWGSVGSTANRAKLTVDGSGNIYRTDGSTIYRYKYDFAAKRWAIWSQLVYTFPAGETYNMLWANDNTVLWARNTNGTLRRLRFDEASQRVVGSPAALSSGWGTFSNIYSMGADTMIGHKPDGSSWKYQYDEATNAWPTASVRTPGTWTPFTDVTGVADRCKLTADVVTAPSVPTETDTPIAALGTSTGALAFALSDNAGYLRYGHAKTEAEVGSMTWTAVQNGFAATGTPSLFENATSTTGAATGEISLVGHGTNSDIYSRDESAPSAGTLEANWQEEGGSTLGHPSAFALSTGATGMVAVDDAGNTWVRYQSLQSNWQRTFGSWRKLGVTAVAPGSRITVTDLGNGTALLLARAADGSVRSSVLTSSLTATAWQNLTIPGAGARGSVTATVYPGGWVRAAVTDNYGAVWTKRQAATTDHTWESAWTPVAPGTTLAGSPSMVVSPTTGFTFIVGRDTDNHPVLSREVSQAGGNFQTFDLIEPSGTTKWIADPTAFTYSANASQKWGVVGYDANRAVFMFAQIDTSGARATDSDALKPISLGTLNNNKSGR